MSLEIVDAGGYVKREANLPASTNAATVAGWYKLLTDRDAKTHLWYLVRYAATATDASIRSEPDGTAMKFIANYGSNQSATVIDMAAGVWYYICASMSGGTATIYWAPEGQTSLSSLTRAFTNLAPERLILGNNEGGEFFRGRLAYQRCWNAALSGAQALAEYHDTAAVLATDLLTDHPMDGADVAECLVDESGNGYDYTLIGTSVVRSTDLPAITPAGGGGSGGSGPGAGPTITVKGEIKIDPSVEMAASTGTTHESGSFSGTYASADNDATMTVEIKDGATVVASMAATLNTKDEYDRLFNLGQSSGYEPDGWSAEFSGVTPDTYTAVATLVDSNGTATATSAAFDLSGLVSIDFTVDDTTPDINQLTVGRATFRDQNGVALDPELFAVAVTLSDDTKVGAIFDGGSVVGSQRLVVLFGKAAGPCDVTVSQGAVSSSAVTVTTSAIVIDPEIDNADPIALDLITGPLDVQITKAGSPQSRLPVSSSNTAIVTTESQTGFDGRVLLTPVAAGSAEVYITVTNAYSGVESTLTLSVTVTSGTALGTVSSLQLQSAVPTVTNGGGPFTLTVLDQDGDALSSSPLLACDVAYSRPRRVSGPASISAGSLTLYPVGVGSSTVTVIYHDPTNGAVILDIPITVLP